MSNKATTRWKQMLYASARKSDPSTHSHVIYGDKLLCIIVLLPCHYCGKKLRSGQATVDHVIPSSKGGPNCASNFVLACEPCNTSKGSAKASRVPRDKVKE